MECKENSINFSATFFFRNETLTEKKKSVSSLSCRIRREPITEWSNHHPNAMRTSWYLPGSYTNLSSTLAWDFSIVLRDGLTVFCVQENSQTHTCVCVRVCVSVCVSVLCSLLKEKKIVFFLTSHCWYYHNAGKLLLFKLGQPELKCNDNYQLEEKRTSRWLASPWEMPPPRCLTGLCACFTVGFNKRKMHRIYALYVLFIHQSSLVHVSLSAACRYPSRKCGGSKRTT